MSKNGIRRLVFAALILSGGIVAARVARTDPPAVLPTTEVKVKTVSGIQKLRPEVARSEGERLQGLMDRTALAEDGGMLFVYQQPQPVRAGFWMYRTHIPLDIAFLNERGVILATHTMPPCDSAEPLRCPTYYSPAPYRFALEVNGGYFKTHGVMRGDRVEIALAARPD